MPATATITTRSIEAEQLDARADRLINSIVLAEGVVNKAGDSYKVAQNTGSDMNVKVGSTTAYDLAVVAGDLAGQGVYICEHQNGSQVLAIAASDPGDPRIDVIALRVYDDDVDGSGNSYADLEVIQGTPAASPSAPALPDGAIKLAEVTVGAGVTAITNANITDSRVEVGIPSRLMMVTPPVVHSRQSSAGSSTMSTTEQAELTFTFEIPSDWESYDVEIQASFRAVDSGAAGSAVMTFRFRRTNTGGTVIGTADEELQIGNDHDRLAFSLIGFDEGRTSTGSVVYVLTTELSAEDGLFSSADRWGIARAWRTA